MRTHRSPWRLLSVAALCCALVPACPVREQPRPNVLWILWDTVRADHLDLYGHGRTTAPFLTQWAAGATVFEDCLSAAGYTLPSHASMFTGLLPGEHCTHNGTKRLADEYVTLAELLRDAGYQTFAFSANPHVSPRGNLVQGFDTVLYPWSDGLRDRAVQILRAKLPEEDRSNEFVDRFRGYERGEEQLTSWHLKAAGELAAEALLAWLGTLDRERPYFAFLNYMEAHRPYIPPRSYREQLMTAEQVEQSYQVDRSWAPMWEYTFGLRDYDERELELTRLTYDAAILELDHHLRALLDGLGRQGALEDTVVILTSDHGEHLGEQHMLDHQHSVYQAVLRVPLVVHYPRRFAPGREARPVMNYDLFPTLLELVRVPPPPDLRSRAVSLLAPDPQRNRFAQEPSGSELGVEMVKELHPDFDAEPWQRTLRALVVGAHKLIDASDGERELYDLQRDPLESADLASTEPLLAGALDAALDRYYSTLDLCVPEPVTEPPITPEQEELLRALGYLK